MEVNKLDNPVWHTLLETNSYVALDFEGVKFYEPSFCPFGAFEKSTNTGEGISQYSHLADDFFIVGNEPVLPQSVYLKNRLICNQMILETFVDPQMTDEIVALETKHKPDLIELVNLVQPGYFRENTMDLGQYFGIFREGKLVSASGERMKMNRFTEISAVVTHPDFVGHGFAKTLVWHTAQHIISENKTPFLHVAETNIRAINLYKKLGFSIRRTMDFWNIVSK